MLFRFLGFRIPVVRVLAADNKINAKLFFFCFYNARIVLYVRIVLPMLELYYML
jgi:hypothetical protein